MKNCIQFFREKVFFEYIKNFNQERIKKFHLLSDDEFYHKVSTHDSMLLGASYIKPGYDTNSEERKKIIVEFLMSIECIDKKTALHKVGGDDRELVNKSISFTCTNYQPNTYCIELLTNILGVRFKRNKDKLIWEEEECDYVVGLADNYNKSSLFLERQILAILNYFTNNCVQIENWEDNFFL